MEEAAPPGAGRLARDRRVQRAARIADRLRPAGLAALGAAKTATALFSLDPLLDPEQPKFHGKAMRIRVLGYLGVLLAVPIAWSLRGRREPYPVGTDLMLSVPLLLDAGGNSLGVYDRAHIDDVVHFANAAILMTAFGAAVAPRVGSRWEAAIITLGAGATGALAWEILEYIGHKLGFEGMNLTYEDTIEDSIESFLGSLVAAGITAARWQPRPERASA